MLHVTGDKLKVRVSKDSFGFEGNNSGYEHGVVVEVPDDIIYLGFHSFSFEKSIVNKEILDKVVEHYRQFLGKIIYWEALQDRGRRFQEGDEEFVLINMTDVLAYDDEDKATAYLIDDIRSGGFRV